jgi:hypothetical protein
VTQTEQPDHHRLIDKKVGNFIPTRTSQPCPMPKWKFSHQTPYHTRSQLRNQTETLTINPPSHTAQTLQSLSFTAALLETARLRCEDALVSTSPRFAPFRRFETPSVISCQADNLNRYLYCDTRDIVSYRRRIARYRNRDVVHLRTLLRI